MKKVLLGTSALALAGAFASPAFAADWEVRVGGYMEQHVAYGDTDSEISGDWNGVDVKEDSEIHFSPSITLDNGIKISARIELEGRTQGDQIDETYLRIQGAFGDIRIGEEDQVSYNMAYAAPDVTFLNINSGSDTKFWGGAGLLNVFTATYPAIAADPAGLSYYSPRLGGFQVGVSYARDNFRAATAPRNSAGSNPPGQAQIDEDSQLAGAGNSVINDPWAIGANYVNSFGDFNVALSGGYAAGEDTAGGDTEAWSVGLNLGFAGFTVGGSYAQWDMDNSYVGPSYASFDNTTWDAGISYETGPWGFSFTYLNMEDDVSGGSYEIDKYLVGANYALAKGVRLNAYAAYADAEASAPGEGSIDEDGFLIGTGIRVDF